MRPLLGSVVAVAVLACPSLAQAQVAGQDSVTGFGSDQEENGTDYQYNVFSGSSGENPGGTVVAFQFSPDIQFDFTVTCLAVTGSRAVIGLREQAGGFVLYSWQVVVDGGGPNPDSYRPGFASEPIDCAQFQPPPFPLIQFTNSTVVVHDAPALPTSKDQCKNGGWRTFGVFKNQGDCVSFVATGRKNQPSGP